MKSLTQFTILTIFLTSLSGTVAAQTADDYHPFLSDKFNLEIGAFWPQIDFTARADGSHPDEEIDFDKTLDLDDKQTAGSISFRWRFGEKWSLWGQYWATSNSGGAVLDEDVEWEDVVFKAGTFAKGGVDLDVGRTNSPGRHHRPQCLKEWT